MEVLESIKDMQWQMLLIKRKLRKKIKDLPDNPNIKRISSSPNCFTMNISEIMKDKNTTFSPEYYDFKYQYRVISKKIRLINITKIESNLENWINTGYVEDIKLHPQVIKYLKEII